MSMQPGSGIYSYDEANESNNRSRLFQQNVSYWWMRDSAETYLRFLPAYNLADLTERDGLVHCSNPLSWMPFRDPVNSPYHLSAWVRKVWIYNTVGHGSLRDGGAVSILSPRSASNSAYDPVMALFSRASLPADPEWKYLVTPVYKDPNDTKSKVVKFPPLPELYKAETLIFNVVKAARDGSPQKTELGLLGAKTAMSSLLGGGRDKVPGIVNTPNSTMSRESVAANPCSRWACGDLTHPGDGLLFQLLKIESAKNPFPTSMFSTVMGGDGFPMRLPLTKEQMEARYNLHNLYDIFAYVNESDIIQSLYLVFNGYSPVSGRHEHVLLNEVFGSRSLSFPLPQPLPPRQPMQQQAYQVQAPAQQAWQQPAQAQAPQQQWQPPSPAQAQQPAPAQQAWQAPPQQQAPPQAPAQQAWQQPAQAQQQPAAAPQQAWQAPAQAQQAWPTAQAQAPQQANMALPPQQAQMTLPPQQAPQQVPWSSDNQIPGAEVQAAPTQAPLAIPRPQDVPQQQQQQPQPPAGAGAVSRESLLQRFGPKKG